MKLPVSVLFAAFFYAAACLSRGAEPEKPAKPFKKIEAPGLENAFVVEGKIFSGNSPHDDTGFETLVKLGVKTIISVDGAAPDVEAAEKHGLQYVHIPFGYDGIESSNALKIVKAVAALPGPVYIHCHHGKHRGPAAIGVACRGLYGWDEALGEDWLKAAGTATNYAGLYRSVKIFQAPTEADLRALPEDFPTRAPVGTLVDIMVKTDAHMDAIKAIRAAGFRTPPKQPDLVPVNEALQLIELFRETNRTGTDAHRGEKFLTEMARAESSADTLHSALKALSDERTAETEARAEAAFTAVSKSCASCHRSFRD